MNWLTVSSLVVLVAVLGVAFWRAYRRDDRPSKGQESLARALRMRRSVDPLIRENKQHLKENSFTPLIKNALGR